MDPLSHLTSIVICWTIALTSRYYKSTKDIYSMMQYF